MRRGGCLVAQVPRQLRDGGRLIQPQRAQTLPEYLLDAREQHHGQEGMAADIEEVVMAAHLAQAQDVAPEFRELHLGGVGRRFGYRRQAGLCAKCREVRRGRDFPDGWRRLISGRGNGVKTRQLGQPRLRALGNCFRKAYEVGGQTADRLLRKKGRPILEPAGHAVLSLVEFECQVHDRLAHIHIQRGGGGAGQVEGRHIHGLHQEQGLDQGLVGFVSPRQVAQLVIGHFLVSVCAKDNFPHLFQQVLKSFAGRDACTQRYGIDKETNERLHLDLVTVGHRGGHEYVRRTGVAVQQ